MGYNTVSIGEKLAVDTALKPKTLASINTSERTSNLARFGAFAKTGP
jgi:hypothetical protein